MTSRRQRVPRRGLRRDGERAGGRPVVGRDGGRLRRVPSRGHRRSLSVRATDGGGDGVGESGLQQRLRDHELLEQLGAAVRPDARKGRLRAAALAPRPRLRRKPPAPRSGRTRLIHGEEGVVLPALVHAHRHACGSRRRKEPVRLGGERRERRAGGRRGVRPPHAVGPGRKLDVHSDPRTEGRDGGGGRGVARVVLAIRIVNESSAGLRECPRLPCRGVARPWRWRRGRKPHLEAAGAARGDGRNAVTGALGRRPRLARRRKRDRDAALARRRDAAVAVVAGGGRWRGRRRRAVRARLNPGPEPAPTALLVRTVLRGVGRRHIPPAPARVASRLRPGSTCGRGGRRPRPSFQLCAEVRDLPRQVPNRICLGREAVKRPQELERPRGHLSVHVEAAAFRKQAQAMVRVPPLGRGHVDEAPCDVRGDVDVPRDAVQVVVGGDQTSRTRAAGRGGGGGRGEREDGPPAATPCPLELHLSAYHVGLLAPPQDVQQVLELRVAPPRVGRQGPIEVFEPAARGAVRAHGLFLAPGHVESLGEQL
jgi:hypothetical protein